MEVVLECMKSVSASERLSYNFKRNEVNNKTEVETCRYEAKVIRPVAAE